MAANIARLKKRQKKAGIPAVYVNDMARAKRWDQPEPGTWVECRFLTGD